jgi:hypothetical protein
MITFNFTFCYIDVVPSLNNSRFGDFVDRIYPIELEIKDTTYTDRSASYLDLHLEIDREGHCKFIHNVGDTIHEIHENRNNTNIDHLTVTSRDLLPNKSRSKLSFSIKCLAFSKARILRERLCPATEQFRTVFFSICHCHGHCHGHRICCHSTNAFWLPLLVSSNFSECHKKVKKKEIQRTIAVFL